MDDYPDIRPCVICGKGVLCDENYPKDVQVVHPACVDTSSLFEE